jgi:hypothetical protein
LGMLYFLLVITFLNCQTILCSFSLVFVEIPSIPLIPSSTLNRHGRIDVYSMELVVKADLFLVISRFNIF